MSAESAHLHTRTTPSRPVRTRRLGPAVPILLLTDRSQLPLGQSLVETVKAAVDGGLSHVLLRETDLTDAERAALAEDFAEIGAVVIAARRPVPGCAAVHLAADQPAVPSPYGRSCHSAEDVRLAAVAGASYATLGPYAVTASKPGYGPPLAPGEYADLPIPAYALGGITPDNAAAAVAAGATGVAVMGAVMRSHDPAEIVHALVEAVS